MTSDAVARFADQWHRERPDLDVSPLLVAGRLFRLAHLLDERLRPLFAGHGLGNGDFDVLAALRRAGAPWTVRPTDLSRSLLVTTGAVTKRLDRLEAAGLVERLASADDGRGKRIRLTEAGRRLTDDLMARHLDNQRRLLSALGPADQERLQALLATLTSSLEPPA